MIDVFQFCVLVAMFANFAIGLLVFLTNTRRTANRLFFLLSICLGAWLYFQSRGVGTSNPNDYLFWVREASAASVCVPVVISALRYAIERPELRLTAVLRGSVIWLACAAVVAWVCQMPSFLHGCETPSAANAMGVPHYGLLFVPFVAYWALSALALVAIFWRGIARAEGLQRIELQFMLVATAMGMVPGVICILVVPLYTGSIRTAAFAPFTVVIWYGTIAYGIATRRIMGVAEFLRRVVTYLLVAGFLTLLYVGVFRAVMALPDPGSSGERATLAHVAAAVAIAVLLVPTNAFLQRQADQLFAPAGGGLADLLHRGSRLAHSLSTIDDLLSAFALLLRDTLALESVRIYLHEDDRYMLRHRQGEVRRPDVFAPDAPLPQALARAEAPLVREVLRRDRASGPAESALVEAQAEAAVVLRTKGEMQGFLLLGRRRGGQAFGHRETDALMLLGDQLGTAVENAALYTRLKDAKQHNEVLLENLVTGVIATDTGGRITVCNREALRILQASAATALGRPVDDVLPEPLAASLRQSLAAGRNARDADAVLYRRTAAERPVRYSTAVFSGHADAVMGALLVLQDTSVLRRLEEQVRRNDRLASLGTLAAGMAHEIKNPLVSLKTFAQLLPERYDDPEFRSAFGPLLGEEVDRIDMLVGQLLDFARPAKPNLALTRLHDVLDASLQLVSQQIKGRGLALVRRIEAPADGVLGDERLLRQVFVNLLLNGIEAMDPGGTLTVGSRAIPRPTAAWRDGQEAAAWIETYVRDTGGGIPVADRARIFDPFFTTKAGGTGLGLSVVHGIVWDHLGCIDVESEAGHGACFRVSLPLQPRSAS